MKTDYPEVDYEIRTRLGRTRTSTSGDPRAILEELFNLLEDYSPVWYTEAHRTRALSVLFPTRASAGKRPNPTYSSQYTLTEDK